MRTIDHSKQPPATWTMNTGRVCARQIIRCLSSTQTTQTPSGDKWHGSFHWTYERAMSVVTLGLVGSAFVIYPNKLVDFGLGLALPLHSHIGFSSIITDYLPKHKFPKTYPVAMGALYTLTTLTLYGLYAFNTEGPGICEGIATVWTAKKNKHLQQIDVSD